MEIVYLVCATIGGTILVCQFVMTVFGLVGDSVDFDTDVDLPDDIDFSGDSQHAVSHGSTWLFSVISFKTIVAALTFFGLAGMASRTGELPGLWSFVIALACGGAAMLLVHWMMKGLYKLNQDGSLRIERSVGRRGRVYVPIPGGKSGEGKIQLKLQNRIVELKAMTSEAEKLPTGARVVISRLLTPTTVEVARIPEATETPGGKEPEDVSA